MSDPSPSLAFTPADQFRGLLDAVSYAVVSLDDAGRVTYVNEMGRRLVGRPLDELCGREAEQAMPEVFGRAFSGLRLEQGLRSAAAYEEYYAPRDLWMELHLCPVPGGALICARDVTARKVSERIAEAQRQVLEMVATGAPLDETLAAITAIVERQSKGDLCSILRLDADGQHLHGAACGSLPGSYSKAIEGAAIGPLAGSCGTAAFTRSRVVVTDIASDPRWAAYRDLALSHGLRACWSQPIFSRDMRRVLGTVANYSARSCEPSERSLRLLETAARLAQIAIEQAEAEEAVRRHALAFEKLSDGIVLADAAGNLTDWNPAAGQMFGLRREGTTTGGSARLPADVIEIACREGQWRGEVGFVRPDGDRGTCERTVVPLCDARGRVTSMIGVDHDVTERKRLEANLLTEASVTRVLMTSTDLAEAMPRLLEAIGTTCGWETGALWVVDEASGVLRCREFWGGALADVAAFEAVTRRTALGCGEGLPGRVWAGERPQWIAELKADDNFPRKALAVAAGLRAAFGFPVLVGGRVAAVLEFFTRAGRERDDALDAMLLAIGREVGQFLRRTEANEALRAAKESLDTANRAKDRFFAVLSHELRTPLSPALLMATALAEDPELPARVREDAAMIQRNIELQTRLIDDLLDVSRIENGKLTVRAEVVDLHELLRDCVRICRHDADAKRVALLTDLAASRHVVDGDPVRLRQVACNLVKNAVKFTPPNGTIALRTSDGPGDARVRVEVIDTGVGMQPEMLHRMFDPFEQAGRAAESKGLGLGLTICKGLVEAHGGRIAASSRGLGTGMTLTIDLPARAGAASTSADEGRSGGPDAGAASPLQILLVDDHADTLRALSRLLRKLNHTVLTADCVRSALAAAGEHEFDLVISDVGLPDGTGTDLMRELLRRGPIRGIALTGYGTESDVQETRAAGFSAHLTKPIDFAELQAVITRGPRP